MGQEVDSLKPAGRVLVATGAACSACGAAAGVGEHCGQCGAALSRRCPACAADNPPDHHYCGECGARLGADSPEPTRPSGGVAEERRWASIVFADLSGFTAVAEQLTRRT